MSALRTLVAEHPPIPNHRRGDAGSVPKGKIPVQHSSNWSGYIALPSSKTKKFTYVNANFSVPSVNCSVTSYAFSYHWVGLDGDTDGTVEQDGVGSFCVSGSPTYFAWSEMYPASPVIQFYLNPGDAVEAIAEYSGGNYFLALTDLTSTQNFDVESACASTCNRSSAEAITEGYPSSPYNGTADFGQEHYDTVVIGNGKTYGGIANPNWTDAESIAGGASGTDTQPGNLSTTTGKHAQSSAFVITWYHQN
jgi:hypothetical protein